MWSRALLQPLQVRALLSVASVHRDHPWRQCVQTQGKAWSIQGKIQQINQYNDYNCVLVFSSAGKTIQYLIVHLQVRCGKCGNGLGHEFVNDGPKRGQSRFWIFSHSLKFVPKGIAVMLASFSLLSLQTMTAVYSNILSALTLCTPQTRLMDNKVSSWTWWLAVAWLEVWALDDEFWGKTQRGSTRDLMIADGLTVQLEQRAGLHT